MGCMMDSVKSQYLLHERWAICTTGCMIGGVESRDSHERRLICALAFRMSGIESRDISREQRSMCAMMGNVCEQNSGQWFDLIMRARNVDYISKASKEQQQ